MKVFRRGTTPAGVTTPCGAISVTLSPTKTPSARELRTEDDVERIGRQQIKTAALHMRAEIGNLVFLVGQDATHQRAAHRLPVGEHALRLHEGRRCGDARLLRRLPGNALPASHFAVGTADLHVRNDGQDAAAQLGLEAVHHRQDDDQRSDAERDTAHRDQRNEGNEMIAPLGARIAQADQQFVRQGHRQRKLV